MSPSLLLKSSLSVCRRAASSLQHLRCLNLPRGPTTASGERRSSCSALTGCRYRSLRHYSGGEGGGGAGERAAAADPRAMVDPRRVVSYEEVRRAGAERDSRALIIDVREPHELQQTGQIPSSINIPLGSVGGALGSSDEEFRRRFARNKPPGDAELIFYCQAGRRSAQALDQALKLGYTNSKTYMGSWQEWASKQQ